MSARRRCAETGCRHAPNAHVEDGCRFCACTSWLDRKPHTWRERVSEAWLLATEAWLLQREAVAIGYENEEAEYEAAHPRPRLADFMHALSTGEPPEVHVCPTCQGTGRDRGAA